MHKRYREMCTLLATGQIEPNEKARLEQHLESCSQCRAFLGDIARIEANGMALRAADRAERSLQEPPLGIRERFVQRAIADGFDVDPGPILAKAVPSRKAGPFDAATMESPRGRWTLARVAPLRAALALSGCVAFAVAGYLVGLERNATEPVIQSAAPALCAASDSTYKGFKAEEAELRDRLHAISSQLVALKREKEGLAEKLAEGAEQIAKGSAYEERFEEQTRELQNAEDRMSKLKLDLTAAQTQLSEKDALLVVREQAAQDAKAKLADEESQLQQLSDLQSARSEIGQLISARNLHIVDVRDTGPGRKRGTAFGRVFYVEGQSLVFYAYDLAASGHPNRQLTFHVWGETASVKGTTYNLGILHSDDSSQARWVLTFDDPKILNRINAVYITAEHDTLAKKKPQGQQLLYAFLGTPNHP